ncbi:DUF4136 domain-containing protein [uncultured Apibacter sp.]|uniref:DUF4136 domain-containing protein n=1 Tax=uncultured Apibacter sp. TaxID=1778616 RepID=UPI0025E65B7D|nr:DUF4136 domain-containing protein [uncultured Apibacter sp.]
MKFHWLSFIFLIVLVSCATDNLSMDYDSEYNFSKIRTYNYYTDNQIKLNNKIDSTNFMKNLDAVLQSKGLQKDTDNPDVFIALEVNNEIGKQSYNTVNLGIGGGNGWFGLGTNVGIPVKNRKVTDYFFKIDFDDAITKKLVWTAKVIDSKPYNYSTANKASFYNSTVKLLFKKYPPKITKKSKKATKNNHYD